MHTTLYNYISPDIMQYLELFDNNNNNNILFYSANIQFNRNLFSALYIRRCVQQVLTRTCKLKITYIITIDIQNSDYKDRDKNNTNMKTMLDMLTKLVQICNN